MELTKEQIEFLDRVCSRRDEWKLNSNGEVDVDMSVFIVRMNLTEIPVKFGRVDGDVNCYDNNLTTLKNCPDSVSGYFRCQLNNLTNYFKNIKEEDFPHWDKFNWGSILEEYPFLINIGKKYLSKDFKYYLDNYPQTKLYLE